MIPKLPKSLKVLGVVPAETAAPDNSPGGSQIPEAQDLAHKLAELHYCVQICRMQGEWGLAEAYERILIQVCAELGIRRAA